MISKAKVVIVIAVLAFLIAFGFIFPEIWLRVIIGVIVVAFAVIVYRFWFRKPVVSTTLEISPPVFQVESGRAQILAAALRPITAPSDLITWNLEGSGQLSSNKGASITYVAPEKVQAGTKVKITANFIKGAGFLNSSAWVEGVILPPGEIAKIATVLTISHPSFSIKSEETLKLTAVLEDYKGNRLTGKAVKWEISPSIGKLSSITGSSVVYTAPKVDVDSTVTITATFEEDEENMASNSNCIGTVAPIVLFDEYILSFDKALMNNVKIERAIEVNDIKVTKISAHTMDISKLGITRVNLTSLRAVLEEVEIYATSFKAYSPELGKTLEIKGNEEVKLEPMDSATFENGVIYFIQVKCKRGELDKPKVVGTYLGGEELYMPMLLTASDIPMEKYKIEGPTSYSQLENMATKIKCEKITASEFSLKCPSEYSLDRENNTYRYTSKWAMKFSSITAEKIEMYAIYFEVKALQVWRVKATGEEYIPSVIPDGFHRGILAPINEANVHVIQFNADKLKVGEVVSNIIKNG